MVTLTVDFELSDGDTSMARELLKKTLTEVLDEAVPSGFIDAGSETKILDYHVIIDE